MADRLGTGERRFLGGVFLLWLAGGYAFLLRTDIVYLWHAPLYALCALFFWKPWLLRPFRNVKPTPVHFVLVATVWSLWVARPLASLLHGDLHPDLLINSLFWIGGSLALSVAWVWLLRRYAWTTGAIVVVAAGLALTEPGYVIVRMAQEHMWSTLLWSLPILFATHAALVAPVAHAYRRTWAGVQTPAPGPRGMLLALAVTSVAFMVGNLLWFALLGWFFRR